MEIIEEEFDIDNRDIEKEMEERDIKEEEEQANDEYEKKEAEKAVKLGKVLNQRNLDIDLAKEECYRNIYTFKKDKTTYTGKALHKIVKGTYIFIVEDHNAESGHSYKKFNLSEIK